jgi:hypothetical protein
MSRLVLIFKLNRMIYRVLSEARQAQIQHELKTPLIYNSVDAYVRLSPS